MTWKFTVLLKPRVVAVTCRATVPRIAAWVPSPRRSGGREHCRRFRECESASALLMQLTEAPVSTRASRCDASFPSPLGVVKETESKAEESLLSLASTINPPPDPSPRPLGALYGEGGVCRDRTAPPDTVGVENVGSEAGVTETRDCDEEGVGAEKVEVEEDR